MPLSPSPPLLPRGSGDNCASFTENNKQEREIAEGKRKPFSAPPVPKFPSWWDEMQTRGQGGGGLPGGGGSAAKVNALRKVGGFGLGGANAAKAAAGGLRGATA